MADTPAHLKDLTPDPRNARKHTPRNVGVIADALREVGAARSIVIDEDGVILAGNATCEAAAEAGITKVQVVDADGETVVAVRRTGLTAAQKAKLALYDNRAAELADGWDAEVLKELATEIDLSKMFSEKELTALVGEPIAGMTEAEARATLTERFGVPPFSVLDARQGYWQARKRAWIALGIESEIGRGESACPGGGARPACDYSDGQRGDGRGRRIAERETPDMGSGIAGTEGAGRSVAEDSRRRSRATPPCTARP